MKEKIKIVLISIIIIVLIIICILLFYSIPFTKANSLLISANKSKYQYDLNNADYISKENYDKLCVIKTTVSEAEFVQLKTRKKFKFVNYKNLVIICSVKATVESFDKIIVPAEYDDTLSISFEFINGKWRVTDVISNGHSKQSYNKQ